MLLPVVTEDRIEMDAVGLDTFVADLDQASADTIARRSALIELAARFPNRRVYD